MNNFRFIKCWKLSNYGKKLALYVFLGFFLFNFFQTGIHADSWVYKSNMPTKRAFTACSILNGKIYVIGGCIEFAFPTDVVEAYDPITDTWSVKAPMLTKRTYAAASSFNGKMYVFGGYTANPPTPSTYTSSVEEYDPLTNTWTYKSSMPGPRAGHASSEINGKIYIAGGSIWIHKYNNLWEYDPLNDTWTVKANMPTTRTHMSSAVIDGKMYVPGGVIVSTGLKAMEAFDPSTNTWEIKSDLITGRWYPATAAVNGKIYVIGGMVGSGSVTDKVEEYDPLTDIWIKKTSLPEIMFNFIDSAATYNGKIYIFGGATPSTPYTDTVLEYTPDSIVKPISIDIKPQSCPNPINVKSKGVLPVAILGTEYFDVTTIDPTSIQLAGINPIRSSIEDVSTPAMNNNEVCNCTIALGDGFDDLVLKFDTQEIVGVLGQVTDGEEIVLTLNGELSDGTYIEGKDCIIVISKGK